MGISINPIDSKKYPYCHNGYQYALDTLEGKVPNCIYVIGACRRFLEDYEKCQSDDYVFNFDIDKAERYLKLVQLFTHVKGEWETPNIVYLPWQNFCFMNIIGFRRRGTNFPRFRIAHIEVPRGSGKSVLASQAALYFLALDNPKGNEISCFATKSDQARIVLDSSRAMAKANAKYLKATGVDVQAHKIVHDKSNSFVRAMSSDDKGMDGLNDVLSIMDELHAMNRELFEVVYSGMSKRRDSLMLCITTAGFSVDSIGFSQSQYAKKVALGEVIDEQLFSVIYTIDENDDIFEESTWKKANPNYGVSVDPITFSAKAEKARITPSDIPNFKVKHLNMWISEANAFYDTKKWDDCFDPELRETFFNNEKVFIGIDLASKVDLTSYVKVMRKDGIYYIWQKAFLPEETINEERNVLYDECIATGELIKTPGEAINYNHIQDELIKESKNLNILGANFDPWNCSQLAQNLMKERINMVEFRMNVANLTEPMKTLDALMRQKKIRHNGGKLLRWCISNVVAKEDHNGNVYPRKSSEKLKIDIAVALLMALASWIQEKEQVSIYETRGIIRV